MKGFWYMIEALLAGIILIGFLVMLVGNSVIIPQDDLSLKGYEILHDLDDQEILRDYVADLNHSGLNSQIKLASYNHSIQICDQGNNCVGNIPSADNVWVGNYYIIAGGGEYDPYLVKLFMWRI